MRVRPWLAMVLLGWLAFAGPYNEVAAAQPGRVPAVDSAPRMPLPSEPPPAALPLAYAALLASAGFLVVAVLALLFLVRWRARLDLTPTARSRQRALARAPGSHSHASRPAH